MKKSLKLNFIMNAILTASSIIFPLITFRYASRILLPTGMGKVSFATSLISYFTMFAQLGIPTYGIRACAKVGDDRRELTRTVHELLTINLVTAAIAYLLLAAALLFVPRLREERTLYLVISLTVFFNFIGMEWLYKGLEEYTYITVRSICFKIVALIALFLLVREEKDYILYGAISIVASSGSNILNFLHAHKYIGARPIGGYDFKRHLKAVGVFFAMSCATTIYTHMDAVMLGFMASDADVGYYEAAVKIKSVLVSIVTALGAVLLPRASYYIECGKTDEFRRITTKAMSFVFVAAIPLIVYFAIFARQCIYFLSGKAYENAILPMQVILPTLLLIGITNVLGLQILVPLGREKQVLYSEIGGAVMNLIANAIFIPKYAATGAAVGTVLAETVVLVMQMVFLRDNAKDMFRFMHPVKIVVGTIAGCAACIWVTLFDFGFFMTLLISACLFFGAYGVTLLLTKEPVICEIYGQLLAKIGIKRG